MLRWRQTVEFGRLVEYYRGLIRLRKRLPGLYCKSADAADRITEETIHEEGVVSFLVNNMSDEDLADGALADPEPAGEKTTARHHDHPADRDGCEQLFILYNSKKEETAVELPQGEWVVLTDGEEADCWKEAKRNSANQVLVAPCSGLMLGRVSKKGNA